VLKVYPFATGSEYTASFAVTASHAISASSAGYVATASTAGYIENPRSGSAASVNLCLITYAEYLLLINNPGTKIERCLFP
jgi:hypothetical protein